MRDRYLNFMHTFILVQLTLKDYPMIVSERAAVSDLFDA